MKGLVGLYSGKITKKQVQCIDKYWLKIDLFKLYPIVSEILNSYYPRKEDSSPPPNVVTILDNLVPSKIQNLAPSLSLL